MSLLGRNEQEVKELFFSLEGRGDCMVGWVRVLDTLLCVRYLLGSEKR